MFAYHDKSSAEYSPLGGTKSLGISSVGTPFAFATRRTFSAAGAVMSSASAPSGPVAIFSMYTAAPGKNIEPRSAAAITEIELGCP